MLQPWIPRQRYGNRSSVYEFNDKRLAGNRDSLRTGLLRVNGDR
jgi:hypothetical protein